MRVYALLDLRLYRFKLEVSVRERRSLIALTPLPLRTRLCDLPAIRYPVIQAPMAGGWTTPELVSEVSNASGLGMLA